MQNVCFLIKQFYLCTHACELLHHLDYLSSRTSSPSTGLASRIRANTYRELACTEPWRSRTREKASKPNYRPRDLHHLHTEHLWPAGVIWRASKHACWSGCIIELIFVLLCAALVYVCTGLRLELYNEAKFQSCSRSQSMHHTSILLVSGYTLIWAWVFTPCTLSLNAHCSVSRPMKGCTARDPAPWRPICQIAHMERCAMYVQACACVPSHCGWKASFL